MLQFSDSNSIELECNETLSYSSSNNANNTNSSSINHIPLLGPNPMLFQNIIMASIGFHRSHTVLLYRELEQTYKIKVRTKHNCRDIGLPKYLIAPIEKSEPNHQFSLGNPELWKYIGIPIITMQWIRDCVNCGYIKDTTHSLSSYLKVNKQKPISIDCTDDSDIDINDESTEDTEPGTVIKSGYSKCRHTCKNSTDSHKEFIKTERSNWSNLKSHEQRFKLHPNCTSACKSYLEKHWNVSQRKGKYTRRIATTTTTTTGEHRSIYSSDLFSKYSNSQSQFDGRDLVCQLIYQALNKMIELKASRSQLYDSMVKEAQTDYSTYQYIFDDLSPKLKDSPSWTRLFQLLFPVPPHQNYPELVYLQTWAETYPQLSHGKRIYVNDTVIKLIPHKVVYMESRVSKRRIAAAATTAEVVLHVSTAKKQKKDSKPSILTAVSVEENKILMAELNNTKRELSEAKLANARLAASLNQITTDKATNIAQQQILRERLEIQTEQFNKLVGVLASQETAAFEQKRKQADLIIAAFEQNNVINRCGSTGDVANNAHSNINRSGSVRNTTNNINSNSISGINRKSDSRHPLLDLASSAASALSAVAKAPTASVPVQAFVSAPPPASDTNSTTHAPPAIQHQPQLYQQIQGSDLHPSYYQYPTPPPPYWNYTSSAPFQQNSFALPQQQQQYNYYPNQIAHNFAP